MFFLTKELLINEGTNRACYSHPSDYLKCIKIDIRENKETENELKYYRKLKKSNVPFEMISEFYGYEQTNLGKATVFELIRDDDGKISQEMDKFLDNNSVDDIEKILKHLPLLKKYIFDNKIYVKDLNPVNVMYQIKKKSNRLVIIDGLAHSNYNPFFYTCDFFIMNKIKNSWNRFIKIIGKKDIIKQNPYLKMYLEL